jgi:DNA-binding response OmpR family regulator
VLLVEDDLVSARALDTIMGRRGFDVSHVITIAAALDQLVHQPAFVILDLMLPDGDGAAVLGAIRDRGLSARVVVITAVSDPDRLAAVHALKPEAIMQKPIDLPRMLSLMKQHN